ncbi:hypothetical protein ACX0G7_13840 [Flavitalea antarctica]
MRRVLVAIIIGFLLSSCAKHRQCNTQPYYTLTASVKLWFPYSGNEDLVFEDSGLRQDTLLLRDFFLGEDDVWNGDECAQSRGQFLRGSIIDRSSNDTIKTEIGFNERVLIERKNTWIHYYDTKNVVSQPGTNRRFESTATINGKSYNNVLVNECAAIDNCNMSGITKYYFAKGKGLVAFERNGIIWTRKE